MTQRKPAAETAKPAQGRAEKPAPRKRIDWEAVERDYRTGKFTLRELEGKHNASYSEISRRSKREGWQKDLVDVVRQATNAAVLRETAKLAQSDATNVVLVAAEVNQRVIMSHRRHSQNVLALADDLMSELRLVTHSPSEIEALSRQAMQGMDADAAEAVAQSVRDLLKLHSRVSSFHKMVDAYKKAIEMERLAHGIKDDENPGDPDKRRSVIPIEFVDAPVREVPRDG